MRGTATKAGVFFRTLWDCLSSNWKETDEQYRITRSRYGGHTDAELEMKFPPSGMGETMTKRHVRGFRSCIRTAWAAAENHYHIPKSRFRSTA